MNALAVVSEKTNGGQQAIDLTRPYSVAVTLQGTSDLLFHRWNCESVAEKAKSAKGSKAKKSDDVESYVYRDDAGNLCLPTEYVRMAIITAAKFKQDPRSPRKSAMDLFKAGIVPVSGLVNLGVKNWDYLDTRRVTVQRAGISRTRPAMKAGWRAEFTFEVLTPEYIDQSLLLEVISNAGRLVGVGDFRPTFGRFSVVGFKVSQLD